MSARDRLTVNGISAQAARAIVGTHNAAVSAAGTTQATATALPADINYCTTVGANSGVIIPPSNPGDSGVVRNGQAVNALSLYPPVGGTINELSQNAAYSVAAPATAMWYCVSPTQFLVFSTT